MKSLLYGVYEIRRWDGDSTQGVPSSWSEECWLTADGIGEKDSPELTAASEWGLWTGDGFAFLKTTERGMNGLETYFPLSGRKEIYYCLILLFKFCPKKFQDLWRESSAYLLIKEDFQMQHFPLCDALEISISIYNCSQRCYLKNHPLWVWTDRYLKNPMA